MILLPTSCDIYLEQNGEKVATVQSYTASKGADGYQIRLFRIYMLDVKRPLCCLDNFSLVAEKPDIIIVYTGCHWKSKTESGMLGSMICESADIIAESREEAHQ